MTDKELPEWASKMKVIRWMGLDIPVKTVYKYLDVIDTMTLEEIEAELDENTRKWLKAEFNKREK